VAPLRSLIARDDASLVVNRERLSSPVAERLRTLIRNGDLPPGTRLVETALADLLGVSRGPVREALRDLDREGFVVISAHKGAVVAEWSLDDLLDAYDVRFLLELKAAARAAERAAAVCAADLDKLLTTWDAAAQAGDREQCADLDFAFHQAIWRAAGNRCLTAALEQTIHPLQTVFYLNATRYDDLFDVVALHRRLRDAIATGDPAAATAAMEAHMENSLEKARRHSTSRESRVESRET
jgi:DNA-binding GntR family transcriptional regulator